MRIRELFNIPELYGHHLFSGGAESIALKVGEQYHVYHRNETGWVRPPRYTKAGRVVEPANLFERLTIWFFSRNSKPFDHNFPIPADWRDLPTFQLKWFMYPQYSSPSSGHMNPVEGWRWDEQRCEWVLDPLEEGEDTWAVHREAKVRLESEAKAASEARIKHIDEQVRREAAQRRAAELREKAKHAASS